MLPIIAVMSVNLSSYVPICAYNDRNSAQLGILIVDLHRVTTEYTF